MPQMAPMNWLMIFIYMIFLILFTSIFIFYSYNKIFSKSQKKNKSSMNWKW